MRKRFRTVKLPEEMIKEIERLVERYPEWGYRSVADFVKDSVRHNYCLHVRSIKPEKSSNCN